MKSMVGAFSLSRLEIPGLGRIVDPADSSEALPASPARAVGPAESAAVSGQPPTPRLSLRNLSKTFRGGAGEVVALQDVSLDIRPGEFVSLLGASGCGKTTLLRIIAGLEREYSGEALLDGKMIERPGKDRGVVFQDHRLLPWLTIEENVGFGLAHLSRKDRTEIVQSHLALVGLSGFAKSRPSQLSGGMAQRAAIARALATDPEILLLDEPLGALDALTRLYMQEELERIWKEKPGLTVVMVTHDVDEAIYLSDRVVLLSPRPGRIKRILDISAARPRSREDAEFNGIKRVLLEEFQLLHEKTVEYVI
jgi:ABC-type nitrate/sulfonate/bicarbonate transport system ATPase subunit